MIYILLDHPRRDAFDLGQLRNVLYGAAAIAPERLKQAIERFGRCSPSSSQTEAPMALTSLPRELHVVADPGAATPVLASGRHSDLPDGDPPARRAGHDVPDASPARSWRTRRT